jgi:hypothetical protein
MPIRFIGRDGAEWEPLVVATCRCCKLPIWLPDGFYLRVHGAILDSEFFHPACAPGKD